MCHPPKSPKGTESHIQKIIYMQDIRIHIALLTDSEQWLNPCTKPQLNPRAQMYPAWLTRFGVMMHKQVTLGSKVAVNHLLCNNCPCTCSSSVVPYSKHRVVWGILALKEKRVELPCAYWKGPCDKGKWGQQLSGWHKGWDSSDHM